MEIALFIKELREQGIAIKLVGDQLEVSLLNDHIESDTLKLLKQRKPEIIEYLSFSVLVNDKVQEIPQIQEASSYGVSNGQLRIWIESQSAEASIAYNMPFEMMLEGDYDYSSFKEAIHYVIGRHEILRTIFRLDDNKELKQYILPVSEITPHIVFKDHRNTDNALKKIDDYIKKDSSILFDLEKGPLLRMAILQYENNKYIFYCNMHHIICDAWSVPILKREIAISHKAIRENKTPSLPKLRIQYKDYAAWYLQQLQGAELDRQKKYWIEKFSDGIPVLEFPLKQGRPSIKTYNGATLKTYFSDDSAKLISIYARRKNGSLFMVMLGTLHVMLSRYTGNEDIIIGSPFAAREHLDLQNQIGFYTNSLAIRNRLEGEDSFDHFFSKVKQKVLEAHANQQYPFEELVKELDIEKDPSRNPLFDVMLVVLPQDEKQGENTAEDFDYQTITKKTNTTSKFDLLFYVQEIDNHLSLRVEYNIDLFEATFIEQFIRHYKRLVDLLLTQPQNLVRDINYLTEGAGVLESAIKKENYPKKVVIELFEDQVSKTPFATAIKYKDITLTYQQLNEYVNQLACCLRQKYQVTSQTNLGVILGRSHWNIVAMLGVMKSGGCYVPIDNGYQFKRKEYILEDAEIKTVISLTDLLEDKIQDKVNVVFLDKFAFSDWDKNNLPIINQLDHSSFIIYTSGSTGNPKGVIQTHRMLSNLIQWNIYDSGIEPGLKYLQYTSFSFDVSLQDCWFVLSSGGTLYITPESIKMDFKALSNFILANAIEVLSLPFAVVKELFDFYQELEIKDHLIKHIISSGEQLMVNRSLENFLYMNPSVKLHNHYGPSETHVITSFIMSGEEGGIVSHSPIGKPVTNTTIYLLDKNLQPVPKKVIGEIYVAGEHLAIGYLKLPELTEERFISNPIQEELRLYKTGDLAYEDYSGNLIYIGREDNQIKVRGYRVELGEIESVLLAQDGIANATVVIRGQDEDKTIIAYLVLKRNISLNKGLLRQRLSKELPKYMLPAYYVELEGIPLTSNGKVDKKKLPEATEKELVKTTYIAPKTQIEKKLEAMWRRLLGIDQISIFDNFFELGGHSLHLTRLLYEINKAFDVKLQIKNIFAAQNIYDLARAIEDEIIFKKGINTNQDGQIENEQNSETWEI